MKKYSAILILIFFSAASYGQNWNCFIPGKKQYFINGNYYLKGIRIDSVKTVGSNTVYYPFHTLRDTNAMTLGGVDSAGGSWVGKKVVADSAGVFEFDNIYKDTVVIKTLADSGESWVFYNDNSDTTGLYYLATVVAKDTMEVLGVVDSIKRIKIQAYRDTGAVSYKVNGFEIVLSKNNGLVQTFELYTFPYHKPYKAETTSDFYIDVYTTYGFDASSMLFRQVKYIIPNTADINKYELGDYFTYQGSYSTSMSSSYPYGDYYEFSSSNQVKAMSVVSAYETDYTIHSWYSERCTSCYPYKAATVREGDLSLKVHPHILFDTTNMPEERGTDILYWYNPKDTAYCYKSPYYRWADYYNFLGEGCGQGCSYKTGFGRIDSGVCYDATGYIGYYIRITGAIKIGNYCHLAVQEIQNETPHTVSISPNPAQTQISITATVTMNNIIVSNAMGQVVYRQHITTQQSLYIDVSNWAAGVYFVKVNDMYAEKFVKE